MNERSKFPWNAVLAALLAGSLAILGLFQLRWIDAWSRSETERLDRYLKTGVERVASDLESELRRIKDQYRDIPAGGDAELARVLAEREHRWRAEEGGAPLVSAVLWVDPDQPDEPRELRDGASTPLFWDAQLGEWGRSLRALCAPEPPDLVVLPASPPGLLVACWPGASAGSAQQPLEPLAGTHYLLLLLDEEQLAQRLALLVDEHIAQVFSDNVQVLVTLGEQVVSSTSEHLGQADFATYDALGVLGSARVEIATASDGRQVLLERGSEDDSFARLEMETHALVEDIDSGPPGGTADEAAGAPEPPRAFEHPRWEVRARHAAGSIAAAVGAVRGRNVALGLGILAVLAGASLLLVLAARRARMLATRQVEFVAGVTHELRTPLTVIRSAAENLRDCVVTEPEHARRYGRMIHDEALRLSNFVERALVLAGARSSLRAEPVELMPLLERAIERFRATAPEAAQVAIDAPTAVPPVLADPGALEHALDNLLGNALKYAGRAARVGVLVASAAGRVDVTVSDDGPGIPQDEQKRLFEPFFRGRAARASQAPGSGLGLTVVRRTMEAQGGSVSLQSEDGGGSAFTLHLRAANA